MKHYLALVLFFSIGYQSFAQLDVESAKMSGNWADYYVQEILLGTGVVAFNAEFTGCDTTAFGQQVGYDSTQIGEFTSTNTIVDIPYGLFLGSGSIEQRSGSAVNPNPGPNSSDAASDPDLAQILPSFTLHNRAVLEFDFVPQGDTIRFKYAFASLEYPGFVCSNFNDVFGFFLSGPGISGPYTNGAENLALLPGTTTEVSINTVNDIPGGSACSPACPCNSQYFVNNYTAPTDTNVLYGGMTVTLEAVAEVVCGDTYHIKLAIADAGDGALDSGVFLEGGSFTSNLIEVNIQTVNGDSTINEGCGEADILFTRGDTTDTSVSYLFFSGTALNGVDFSPVPDTIVLLPGVQDTTITIAPFADALFEGVETFTIQAVSVTLCGDTFVSEGTLYIYDIPNITTNSSPPQTFTCPPDSVVLWCTALSGGPPPFTYSWSTGDTGDSIVTTLSPNGGIDTFLIEIEDSCAITSVFDTVYVIKDYSDDPQVEILNDSLVNCAGESIALEASTTDGTEPISFLWSSGDTSAISTVVVNGNQTVFVTITDSCGRTAIDTAFLGVKEPEDFTVTFPDSMIFCRGAELLIEPNFSGGVRPYSYDWNETNPVYGDDSIRTVLINQDTTIHFWVQDACGREYYSDFFIQAFDVDTLKATLPSEEARCSGDEFVLNPVVTGGLAPITYEWSTGDSDTVITFVGSVSQLVGLTVTDGCLSEATANALIEVPDYGPLEIFVSGDEELCFGDEYIIEVRAQGGAGDYNYGWIPVNAPIQGERFDKIDSSTFSVISRQNNSHIIVVSDYCGTSTSDTLSISIDPCVFIPNVITPNGDGLNDAFEIRNIEQFEDANLVIYNRWGQKIFESVPYRNEWIPINEPEGTYYYILSSEHFNEARGTVTVIKESTD